MQNRLQFAVREDVLAHEWRPARVRGVRPQGDAVVQVRAARPEALVDLAEEHRQVLVADVLAHSDARRLVVLAGGAELAVVTELDPHTVRQPRLGDRLLRALRLLAGQRYAGRLNAVVLRRVD